MQDFYLWSICTSTAVKDLSLTHVTVDIREYCIWFLLLNEIKGFVDRAGRYGQKCYHGKNISHHSISIIIRISNRFFVQV